MNCIGLYIENYFGSFLSFTVIFTPNMRTIYCECRNFVKFSLELQWIEVERKCKTRNRCVNALLNRRLISSAIVYIRVASLSLYTSVHCYTVTEIEYFRIGSVNVKCVEESHRPSNIVPMIFDYSIWHFTISWKWLNANMEYQFTACRMFVIFEQTLSINLIDMTKA